jgi:four helix bundle protein
VYYHRFEDLPVWNDAIGLAVRLLGLSQAGHLSGVGDLKSQLERVAISISNNIAEGFERGTNEELLSFLYIAKGSAAEVRSMLHLPARLPRTEELAPPVEELLVRVEKISRQLGRWIESLKDSTCKGKRYQNSQTRQAADAVKRRDQFLVRIREIQDEAMRARESGLGGGVGTASFDDTKSPAKQGGHASGDAGDSRDD